MAEGANLSEYRGMMEGKGAKGRSKRPQERESKPPTVVELERGRSDESKETPVEFEQIVEFAIELYRAVEHFKADFGIEESKAGEINFYPVLGTEEVEKVLELIQKCFHESGNQEEFKKFRRLMDKYRGVFPNERSGIIRKLEEQQKIREDLYKAKEQRKFGGIIKGSMAKFLKEPSIKKRYENGEVIIREMAEKIDLSTAGYCNIIKKIIEVAFSFVSERRISGTEMCTANINKRKKIKQEFSFLVFEGSLGMIEKNDISIDWEKFFSWCEKKMLSNEEIALLSE
ncbi:MAG TPA: hypothetical protein VJB41_00760 [Patescibacteria group bacterium]|nr:hypothetical protein [Patescibacteria group bacterium]